MKFLLDHDVPVDVSYSLKHLGHQVFRLPEILNPATSDEEVLIFARQRGLILITCNRDDSCSWRRLCRMRASSSSFGGKPGPLSAALIRLLDKAGETGVRKNINFA
jgi:uncharacterized protein DUF5615